MSLYRNELERPFVEVLASFVVEELIFCLTLVNTVFEAYAEILRSTWQRVDREAQHLRVLERSRAAMQSRAKAM